MRILNENEVNLAEQGKTIVDFYADWCGPCQYMGPFFEEAEKEINALGYTCYKVNVDNCEQFSVKNKISFIPCVIMFNDGKEIARFTGGRDKDGIMEFVYKNIH